MTKLITNVPLSRDWRELLTACNFASVDPYLESLCARTPALKAAPTLGIHSTSGVASFAGVISQIRASGWSPCGIMGLLAACSADQDLSELIAPDSVFEHDEYGPLIPYVTKRNGRVLVLEPVTERISDAIAVLVTR